MHCLYCKHPKTRVIRTIRLHKNIIRTRECAQCGELFDTSENSPEQCPKCGAPKNKVISSNAVDGEIVRVRQCGNSNRQHKWVTQEQPVTGAQTARESRQ